jgi:hypothetical protein
VLSEEAVLGAAEIVSGIVRDDDAGLEARDDAAISEFEGETAVSDFAALLVSSDRTVGATAAGAVGLGPDEATELVVLLLPLLSLDPLGSIAGSALASVPDLGTAALSGFGRLETFVPVRPLADRAESARALAAEAAAILSMA